MLQFRVLTRTFFVELTRSPVAIACLGVSALSVVAAMAARSFPGCSILVSRPILVFGPLVGAIWIGLYAAVGLVYLRVAPGRPVREVVNRLAWCFLLLALLGMLPHLHPVTTAYIHARFAGKAWMLAALLALCGALLPRETGALLRRSSAIVLHKRWRNPYGDAAMCCAILIVLGETAFQLAYGDDRARILPLDALPLALNLLLLACAAGVLFTAANRLGWALYMSGSLYLLLAGCNMLKTHHVDAAIQPGDIHYATVFFPYFTMFFGVGARIGMLLAATAWLIGMAASWRKSAYRAGIRVRVAVGAGSASVLVLLGGIGIADGRDVCLRQCGIEPIPWDSVTAILKHGLLLEIALELPLLSVPEPEGYDEAAIDRCVREYILSDQTPQSQPKTEMVDLVVCIVESLMDPRDIGVRFTSDPIPTLRRAMKEHTAGYAIVPGRFQGSANTEFEVLTGMAMCFLPAGSCPYKSFVKRELPSLPRTLSERGYATSVVHAVGPRQYNYGEVYDHLSLDRRFWLEPGPGHPLDVAGRWRSDDDVLNHAATAADRPGAPNFVFCFPAATHCPYNYDHYLQAELDVSEPMSEETRNELKTYINAIHAADQAVGRLLDHFQRSPRKTVVAILGDHLPPTAYQGGVFAWNPGRRPMDFGVEERQHRVPLVIWSNFPTPRDRIVCSTNFLAVELLKRIGVKPDGFLAANGRIHTRFNVLSTYAQTTDGRRFAAEDIPQDLRETADDYRLLQHDYLSGKRYAAGWDTVR